MAKVTQPVNVRAEIHTQLSSFRAHGMVLGTR